MEPSRTLFLMTAAPNPRADSLLFAYDDDSIFIVDRGFRMDSALYFGEVSKLTAVFIIDFFLVLFTTFW